MNGGEFLEIIIIITIIIIIGMTQQVFYLLGTFLVSFPLSAETVLCSVLLSHCNILMIVLCVY